MGTRSTIKIFDEEGEQLVNIYNQYDGYPSGVGIDLARMLLNRKITNGYTIEQEEEGNWSNGMSCLAAYIIMEFKKKAGIGGTYIHRPSDSQSYNYEVRYIPDDPKAGMWSRTGTVRIACQGYDVMFEMTPEELLKRYGR